MEILSGQEHQHGPQNLASKNQIRKALGLSPIRDRSPELAAEPVAGVEDKPRGRKSKLVE
jgi:hypothetical protein